MPAKIPTHVPKWWIVNGPRRDGPYDQKQIVAFLRNGGLSACDLAIAVGTAHQKALQDWSEFASVIQEVAAVVPSSPSPAPAASASMSFKVGEQVSSLRKKLPGMKKEAADRLGSLREKVLGLKKDDLIVRLRRIGIVGVGVLFWLVTEMRAVCLATKDQTVRLVTYMASRFKARGNQTGTALAPKLLLPKDSTESRRVGIGYVLVIALVCIVLAHGPKGSPKELTVDLGSGVKLEMVLIPAGSFNMGGANEKPVHKVTITKPFYLGTYEVTQDQWEAVMGDNPSQFKGAKYPVEQVSWDDCQKFLFKLNENSGGQGGKFVLPTEAQWEYACRAGSTTQYCFGDDEARLGDYAWYDKNSDRVGNKTRPVGEKAPNAWGLYDMHGNVWEWCADWYGDNYYSKSPADDPSGSTTGTGRVTRGGGWLDPARRCRSAVRGSGESGRRLVYLGLRVARVPESESKEIVKKTDAADTYGEFSSAEWGEIKVYFHRLGLGNDPTRYVVVLSAIKKAFREEDVRYPTPKQLFNTLDELSGGHFAQIPAEQLTHDTLVLLQTANTLEPGKGLQKALKTVRETKEMAR